MSFARSHFLCHAYRTLGWYVSMPDACGTCIRCIRCLRARCVAVTHASKELLASPWLRVPCWHVSLPDAYGTCSRSIRDPRVAVTHASKEFPRSSLLACVTARRCGICSRSIRAPRVAVTRANRELLGSSLLACVTASIVAFAAVASVIHAWQLQP